MIKVNGRFLTQRVTGSQRYAHEVTRRLVSLLGKEEMQVFVPRHKGPVPEDFVGVTQSIGRLRGHLWEQLELGLRANRDGGVLWSPVNVGPVVARRHVVTIHDLSAIQFPEWVGKKFHAWYSFLLPRLAASAEHVITDSEYSRAMIVETLGVPEEKVSAIYLAAEPKFTAAGRNEVARLRGRYGLPESFVLTLGSLEPRKNLSRVVSAWLELDRSSRLPLVIAGGLGDQKIFGDYDVAALRRHEDVLLTGYVPEDDLPALYSAATVFVYVSLLEGFGLPPLEAMSCGTPVITSNTTSLPEVVGDAAVTVNPKDVEAIAESMQRMLSDGGLRIEMRDRGFDRARLFSWDETSEDVLQILQRVASN
jgi:glycosyltransferase involved in cell wall biosynthesis